jgi:hypothetical protein
MFHVITVGATPGKPINFSTIFSVFAELIHQVTPVGNGLPLTSLKAPDGNA